MLCGLPRLADPNVLVGFDTADDAGVYKLTPECALVQTVDFFTPIVDDPYLFGAIAAANSLSDVYAMGGRPLSALSIVGWPVTADIEDLRQMLRGGADKMIEAGCVILGGHSIYEDEPKFGYAVTGVVHPDRVKANSGARPGDALMFTKRIGTGVISTALKRGIAADEHVAASIESMTTLNRKACEAMLEFDVGGCTDVTGFGFLGHAREMALASKVMLEIEAAALRFLPGAVEYAAAGALPGGLRNNREFVSESVVFCCDVLPGVEDLLYDPQTSGGLLISLPEADATALVQRYPDAFRIGRVVAGRPGLRIV